MDAPPRWKPSPGIEGGGGGVFRGLPHDQPRSGGHDGREIGASGPVIAAASFLYTLLTHDCRSALESCGLDSQCGFLHRDRPGRPSLALDLMEEFRGFLADRTALSLLNRKQLTSRDFDTLESGAVVLQDASRKVVMTAWQERKQEEITHPFLDEKTTIGLLPHLQARLLARHLRGDLDAYPAFLAR
ncbi:MAG: CRISPR-associated endonuclease Cas1 [Verrucomicrobiales bacterium]